MKKIKFLFAAVFALAVSSYFASAQDPDECMLYLSYYQEYYKQGSKESKMMAIPSWRKAFNICKPGTRQNLYIHGADLYRLLISQNAKNEEYRNALIDTLVSLHELRAQYYPKYADKAYAALAGDVNNYLQKDPARTYSILSKIIETQGDKCTPGTFVTYMNASVALYKAGQLNVEDVIKDYDNSVSAFSAIQKTDTTQLTRNLRATVEGIFINSRVASCENLQQLFASRYEEAKNDVAEVTKIVRLMASAEDCTDNDLYLKAVTQMHKLEPSASSAYYLARLHASHKEIALATKYFEEAIASEGVEDYTRAQWNYEMAAFNLKNGNYAKAVEAANKALALDKNFAAKAYMLIAHAWMGTPCGGNEIERRAKYWVAVDNFQRAKAADPELTEDANKQIAACAGYYPDTAEAFMYDAQEGQSYTAACGALRATTTVRTRK